MRFFTNDSICCSGWVEIKVPSLAGKNNTKLPLGKYCNTNGDFRSFSVRSIFEES